MSPNSTQHAEYVCAAGHRHRTFLAASVCDEEGGNIAPPPTQHADLERETRFRWEPIDPEAPEGWRRCDFSEFSQDYERWFVLYTNAPRDKNPHQYDTYWRAHRKVVQERFVTEWRDVDPALQQFDGYRDHSEPGTTNND